MTLIDDLCAESHPRAILEAAVAAAGGELRGHRATLSDGRRAYITGPTVTGGRLYNLRLATPWPLTRDGDGDAP